MYLVIYDSGLVSHEQLLFSRYLSQRGPASVRSLDACACWPQDSRQLWQRLVTNCWFWQCLIVNVVEASALHSLLLSLCWHLARAYSKVERFSTVIMQSKVVTLLTLLAALKV